MKAIFPQNFINFPTIPKVHKQQNGNKIGQKS